MGAAREIVEYNSIGISVEGAGALSGFEYVNHGRGQALPSLDVISSAIAVQSGGIVDVCCDQFDRER